MAKPPPRQRQPRPPPISRQGAPYTGRLINTPLDVFDGKRGNSENFMTEFAPRNGRNCRTQTTADSMATLECRPNVDGWMTHQLTAVKKSHRVKDPMAENENNLRVRIDFVTGPQNVSTKATNRPDAYNRPTSHQIYEGDSDTHTAEFRGLATNASSVPINTTTIDISIRRQGTRHETIDKWTITIRKEHKRRDTVLAGLGQNGSQNVGALGGKTMGQVSRTLQPPNRRQEAGNIGQDYSRDPNAMDVDRATVTITNEEIRRYGSKVICSVCFGRGYIYDTCCPPAPQNMQGGSTSASTEDVMHDQNYARGNENDDSHARVAKTDPALTNEDGEAKEFDDDCKKLEDVVVNGNCARRNKSQFTCSNKSTHTSCSTGPSPKASR